MLLFNSFTEKSLKKYCGGVYPSYVHYFPATYVLFTKNKKSFWKKKEENTVVEILYIRKTRVVAFFMLWLVPQQVPLLFGC